MAGHCVFFETWLAFAFLATTTCERVCTSGNLCPWEADFWTNGSQAHGPRVSLRLPKAQGRGEGLRPCLGNVVSYTWVCGILLTRLPPLGIGVPQQAPIVRRKPFLPQGSPGCVRWG